MTRAWAALLVVAVSSACSSGGAATEATPSTAPASAASPGVPRGSASAPPARRGPSTGDVASRRIAALDLLDGQLGAAALALEATDDGGPIDLGLGDELNPRGGPGRVQLDGVSISGPLVPETVTRAVEAYADRVRGCYDRGRAANASLAGHVGVRFVVNVSGELVTLSDGGSDMPDARVGTCVLEAYRSLKLRGPEQGICTVSFRWRLEPPQ